MKNLNEIECFTKVAQLGSFSKAAKLLDLPVSTVSRKVAELERRLGVSLIQRTTRKLHLTGAGESYLRSCAELLQGLEEAELRITEQKAEHKGMLRISIPAGMAGGAFMDFASGFLNKNPGITFEFLITNLFVDLIAENVDVAVRFGKLKDSSLMAQRLGTSRNSLVAAPSFVKKFGQPRSPKDLESFDCLTYMTSEDASWEFLQGRSKVKVRVSGKAKATDMLALKHLALRGHGIAWLPEMYCISEVEKGQFVRILPQWESEPVPVHAVYPNRRYIPARVTLFLQELRQWKEGYWTA